MENSNDQQESKEREREREKREREREIHLTARLCQILQTQWRLDSSDTNELAAELGLKPSTIDSDYQLIYEQLGVRTRSGAMSKAIKLELINVDIPEDEKCP